MLEEIGVITQDNPISAHEVNFRMLAPHVTVSILQKYCDQIWESIVRRLPLSRKEFPDNSLTPILSMAVGSMGYGGVLTRPMLATKLRLNVVGKAVLLKKQGRYRWLGSKKPTIC